MTFRINRVYTRSGDDGMTGLAGGGRVSKASPRVASYGEVDELNSVIGCLKELLPASCSELGPLLERIQQELFDLGAELATPVANRHPGMWQASAADIAALEKLCDQYGDNLPELTSFILPGGSPAAGWLHLARTVCRRAERAVVALRENLTAEEEVNLYIVHYLNRLSDLCFILARWTLEREGKTTPLWVPASQRKAR